MKRFLKRLLYVFGVFPMLLFAFSRWLFTGKPVVPFMDRFDEWVDL
jgi:hypothetical protein